MRSGGPGAAREERLGREEGWGAGLGRRRAELDRWPSGAPFSFRMRFPGLKVRSGR